MIDSNMVRGENGARVLGNSTASAADGRFAVPLGEAIPAAAPSPSGGTPVIFYIVRHGQTEYNLKHLVQGWCDAPLTEAGVRDARACGRGLARAGIEFAAAYSSDLGRAVQTMGELLSARSEVAPELALPSRMSDSRIREWCYGDLESRPGTLMRDVLNEGFGCDMPFEELNVRLPETADAIKRWDASGKAESWEQIKARLGDFYCDVARKVALSGGGNVLVVTHSFVIRSTMYLLDPARVNDPVKIENASVTKVTCDDGFACETGAFSSALFTLGVTGSTSFLGSRL